jgi:hypothetical protein
VAKRFVVRGSGDNIVLERRDDDGNGTTARPASAEELLMYNGLAMLQRKVYLALQYARELAAFEDIGERDGFLNEIWFRDMTGVEGYAEALKALNG